MKSNIYDYNIHFGVLVYVVENVQKFKEKHINSAPNMSSKLKSEFIKKLLI